MDSLVPFQKPLNLIIDRQVVKVLREWVISQPHLPQQMTDAHLQMFYDLREGNIEATKLLIDNHFTLKTKYPEFFYDRDPGLNIHQLHNLLVFEFESHAVPDHLVLFSRLKSPKVETFDFCASIKAFLIYLDYVNSLQPKTTTGLIVIVDMEQITEKHIPLFVQNATYFKNYLKYVQEGLNFNLKGIHVVNTKPYVDKIMNIIRPFLQSKILKIIHFHSQPNEMANMIPMETFPNEYGGQRKISLFKEADLLLKELLGIDASEWFLVEQRLRVDEGKRPPPASASSTSTSTSGSASPSASTSASTSGSPTASTSANDSELDRSKLEEVD